LLRLNREFQLPENHIGLLVRIATIFSRRKINIESLNTSPSEAEGIHRFTIVVLTTEEMIKKLVAQLDKQIDILKAFYYEKHEIIYQEIALYKIPSSIFGAALKVEKFVREYNVRILEIEPEFIVFEKTGTAIETEALLEEFKKYGIFEFVRSGRVAITRPMESLKNYMKRMELSDNF
jgi:acetolactate synthase-1/3 small subunit